MRDTSQEDNRVVFIVKFLNNCMALFFESSFLKIRTIAKLVGVYKQTESLLENSFLLRHLKHLRLLK
jgi:hypothetical protein